MISVVTLDAQDGTAVALHETAKRCVVTASGLIGIAPLRESRRIRPQADGGIDDTRFQDGRVIALEGEIMSTAGVEDAYAEFRTITAPMLATLGGTPALLKWTEGASGLQLQRLVKFAGGTDPTLSEAAAVLRYQAQFYAEDPAAYSQTLTTAVGSALSVIGGGDIFPDTFTGDVGGDTFAFAAAATASFTNAGNADTRPLLRIYGDATNPAVVAGSRRITLVGTISDGEYLEIDLATRRLTRVNGAVRTNATNMLDAANTQWFALPPGTTLVQMLAASFSGTAHLDVIGRSAYA